MSKENGHSISPASCNGIASIPEDIISNGIKEIALNGNNKTKRIRFYHNGNRFFNGVFLPVSSKRYRSFDTLKSELTKIFTKKVTMPTGVQNVYTMDGLMVLEIDELEDGKAYVCGGRGELFKKIDYGQPHISVNRRVSNSEISVPDTAYNNSSTKDIRPRFITLVRNGAKPRKVFRVLLNKRNAANTDQFLKVLTEAAQLDTGAARKVFTASGQLVTSVSEIFACDREDVYFLYGTEKYLKDDFKLTMEETIAVQTLRKRRL